MKTTQLHSKKSADNQMLEQSLTPMQIFSRLCEIPHRSYHTQEMFNHLCSFCENLGLEVRTDKAKNIYICKKAQKYSNKQESKNTINANESTLSNALKDCTPKICLQAHYDMVGVGRAERGEAIKPYIDGQFLRARESSLGADNGIGVACVLWLFTQEKYAPYIEAILTNDEEVGLCGANELELPIKSRFLLNLDSEFFGEIITGCAGGFDVEFDFCAQSMQNVSKGGELCEANLNDINLYEVEAFGFEGGHSGIDIDKHIRSSIVEFAKVLEVLCKDSNAGFSELYALNAGEKSNSIPVGLSAIMSFRESTLDALKEWLEKVGFRVESSTVLDEKVLRIGLVDIAQDCPQNLACFMDKNDGIKIGFLLKHYSKIGDYKRILEQKPYDKRLLSRLILELKQGVWERGSGGEVVSSLNIAMIESNLSLGKGNSPAGNHLANPSAPLHCGARTSAPHSQGETIYQSTTSSARIVDSSEQDSSENGNSSSLRDLPKASRGNPNLCHTELKQGEGEVSQIYQNNRNISVSTKPQYDNKINTTNNDNEPTPLHFTLKARANTNALLKSAKKRITHTLQNLLESKENCKKSANIRICNEYGAWASQNDNASGAEKIHPILQIIIDAYKWRHCEVGSIHAGLECGILQERFAQMGLGQVAMASIGPSILSPHSLQERLDLGSFEEFIEVLTNVLDNICALKSLRKRQ